MNKALMLALAGDNFRAIARILDEELKARKAQLAKLRLVASK